EWPDAPPHPAIFFAPGRGLDTAAASPSSEADHYYWPFFEPLVEAGFVVFAIQPSNDDWGGGRRRAALACAMLWAKDSTNGWALADNDLISDDIVLMGHSRGGSGATRLTKSLDCQTSGNPSADGCCFSPASCDAYDDLPSSTALDDYQV